MKTISLAQLNERGWKTSRDLGRALAEFCEPGDTIDCLGFDSGTNSFADEFIWRFLERHNASDVEEIRFENASPLFVALIHRAKARRIHHVTATSIIPHGERLAVVSECFGGL